MSHRVIPILPAVDFDLLSRLPQPRLIGEPDRIDTVLQALEQALGTELGLRGPQASWLRELRLDAGEAYLALSPGLCGDGHRPAEVAFVTLRRLLPDTDIYVGAGSA